MAISAYLSALDDEHLVALLRRRPDLATPSPVTLASLAARATSRSSLERALASVDAAVLQVVEAVVALAPDGPPTRERVVAAVAGPASERFVAGPAAATATNLTFDAAADPVEAAAAGGAAAVARGAAPAAVGAVSAARRAAPAGVGTTPAAVGAVSRDDEDAALVERALDDAVALALVWPDGDGLHAAPGLAELLGPYPAGLAPAGPGDVRTAAHDESPGSTARDERAGAPAPDERPPGAAHDEPAPGAAHDEPAPGAAHDERPPDAPPPDDGSAARDRHPGVVVPGDLPADARAVLDALTWGPPLGLVPAPGNPAVPTVARLLDAGLLVRGGPRQVVLPRAVALALRQGRTHRDVARPPAPDRPVRPESVVAAESASAAERIARLVVRLVALWGETPPAVLRAGGLGVRELRTLARSLDVDEQEAAFVVELAGAAGLVADDGEERPSFAPTDDADAWLRRDLPARWARLATAWLTTERAPWLVGTRDERGSAHGALEPDLHRRWVPRVRAAVLDVLASTAGGTALALDDVLAVLHWRTPRSAPPSAAAAALLREAALLGVTGADALSPAGRALRDGGETAAAAKLADSLPAPVDEVLLQGDLTGIVPGRPGDRLAALLERTAAVESRGGALTVRFTPESVRGALDAGATAEELLAGLGAVARAGVPQPLEYLIRDTARRHGLLRAGVATSYLRTDDATLLAGLPDDPRLAGLGLRALAPTVLVAAVSPADLVAALRERGLAPVVEGPDGLVVHAPAAARRTRARTRREEQPPDDEARLAALVERLRRTEAEIAVATGHGTPADTAPATRRGAAGAHVVDPATSHGSVGIAVTGRWGDGHLGSGPTTARAATGGAATGRLDRDDAATSGQDRDDAATGGQGGGGARRAAIGAAGAAVRAGGAPARTGGTDDPATALLLLREAAAERSLVWVDVVGGRGVLERRLLRPVSVDGGRLRAIDPAREAELVVAVHRIAAVEPAS